MEKEDKKEVNIDIVWKSGILVQKDQTFHMTNNQ